MRRLLPLLLIVGCKGNDGQKGEKAATWHGDVAKIAYDRCVSCHQEGQIAPFSMETYEDASPWADLIAEQVSSRAMPPFAVDNGGHCEQFTDAAWLSDTEIALFESWALDGGAEGKAPKSEYELPVVERLGEIDLSLDIGLDYTPTQTPDDYRCFIVDPELTEDQFLTRYEVEPGNAETVHHVILYTLDTAESEDLALGLEEVDGEPGYTCFGSSVVPDSRPIAAWAPGTPVTAFPEGTGVRLIAGRKLVLQVHYNTSTSSGPDRTQMHLDLEESVPSEALVFMFADISMELEPGRSDVVAPFEFDLAGLGLPLGAYVRGVFPHMHLRGRTMKLEVVREQGTECLADVPAWDFNWQQLFFYERSVYLFTHDTLRLTCTFDTSGDSDPVSWGDGTGDEMCLIGLFVTLTG